MGGKLFSQLGKAGIGLGYLGGTEASVKTVKTVVFVSRLTQPCDDLG